MITDEILIEDIVELVDNAITQANIDVEPIWRAHRAAESRRRRIADRGAARATPSDYWRNINERVRELTPTSDYRFRPVCQWQVGDVTDVRDALVSGSVFAQRQ
ncbi:hypothetical protein [Gordonia alkanivorans]|uniref:hypothetical protein n=1 Tax=Gordonia alkanivorans TaxID=84096 RepID=UPI0024495578|nr:hypothetical protein [Gordonia alkanivorans]MDH3047218.1 hypothetical protein [Gordonia alkanivorans]